MYSEKYHEAYSNFTFIKGDITFIENVVQANIKLALRLNKEAVNQIYNVACGERTISVVYDVKGTLNIEDINGRL